MAFPNTGAVVWEADASQTTALTGATTALVDANFSTSGTATIVEIDNSTDKAKYAKVEVMANFSVAPDNGSNLELWILDQDTGIGGSNAVDDNDATAPNGARMVGSVQLTDSTSAQYMSTIIPTFGMNKYKLALYNDSGQSIPTGWTVKVMALADLATQ